MTWIMRRNSEPKHLPKIAQCLGDGISVMKTIQLPDMRKFMHNLFRDPELSGRCNQGLKSSAHLQTSNTVGIRAFSHGILRGPSGTPRTTDLRCFDKSLHNLAILRAKTP
jgi:hypothetical protein